MTITERAEQMTNMIMYIVAMHDSMHRRPYLVELCKDQLKDLEHSDDYVNWCLKEHR